MALLGLVATGHAAPVAKPLADLCTGKSDRLAMAEFVSAGSPEHFITVARRVGASTTVLERVAVAH